MTRFLAHALPALLTIALLSTISARADDAATAALPDIKSVDEVPAGTPLREPDPVLTEDKYIVLAENDAKYSEGSSGRYGSGNSYDEAVDHALRTVFGQVAYGEFEFSPRAPIGFESLSNNIRYPIVLDDDADGVQSGAGFFLDTTRYLPPVGGNEHSRSFFNGGFNYFDTDIRQSWSEINPFGDYLLLPGTGDSWANYPAGVALSSGVSPGNPNGFNVIFDPYFRHQFDSWTAYMKWGQICPGPWYYLGGFVGLAYTDANLRMKFWGDIPGYSTEFAYMTNASIETLTPLVGILGVIPIDGMNLFGSAHAGLDVTDVHGDDYFKLSGGLNDSQHVRLEDDDTGFNFNATVGLQFPVAPFSFTVGGAYQHNENYPTIVRTGNSGDYTQIHFSDQSFWVAGIQIGLDLQY